MPDTGDEVAETLADEEFPAGQKDPVSADEGAPPAQADPIGGPGHSQEFPLAQELKQQNINNIYIYIYIYI